MQSVEREVCPGTPVTFTCTVADSSLRWKIKGVGDRVLSATTGPTTIEDFQLEVTNSTTNNVDRITSITSTATAIVTEDIEITCVDTNKLRGNNSQTATLSVIMAGVLTLYTL